MKKILLVISVCILAVFISSTCSAEEMYLNLKSGLTMLSDSDAEFAGGDTDTAEFDPGYSVSGAMGGQINERMRIEALEISYQRNEFDKSAVGGGEAVYGDITSLSFMTNFYYDFINNSKFTPYLGTGGGIARIKADVTSGSDNDEVFAYHLTGGIGWELGPNVILDCSYRYFGTRDAELNNAEIDFDSHNFYVGGRLYF